MTHPQDQIGEAGIDEPHASSVAAHRLTGFDRLVVTSIAVLCYGWELGGARTLTYHEALVGGIARQMHDTGEWLLPHIGEKLWVEKPPLIHWLTAWLGGVFGFTEASVRVVSVVAAIGVVLIVSDLAARWFGRVVGLLTALVQGTAVYMVTYARLAEVDMLLLLLVVACLYSFVRHMKLGLAWDRPIANEHAPQASPDQPGNKPGEKPGDKPRESQGWLGLFWLLLGLSQLTKGPLFGAAIVISVCVSWLVVSGNAKAWRRLLHWPAMVAAVLVGVSWMAAVAWLEPEAMKEWWDNTIVRAADGYGFGKPWYYFLTTWPWQLLPWTPWLLLAARPSIRRATGQGSSVDRFLWCWILVPAVMLSLSRGKHHHYLIHVLPAASPLCALGLYRYGQWLKQRSNAMRFATAMTLLAIVITFPLVATRLASRRPLLQTEVWIVASATALLSIAACAFALSRWRRRMGAITAVTVIAIVFGLGYAHSCVLPRRDRRMPDRQLLARALKATPTEAPLLAVGEVDASRYKFYLGSRASVIFDPNTLPERLGEQRPVYVVGPRRIEHMLRGKAQTESVTHLDQSESSPSERTPEDRLTFFRVD